MEFQSDEGYPDYPYHPITFLKIMCNEFYGFAGDKLAVSLHEKVIEHIDRELKDAPLFKYC